MSAAEVTATTMAQTAVYELRDQARQHKRLSAQHRADARALMQRIEEIRRNCAAVGITIHIEPEANSHGRHHTTS